MAVPKKRTSISKKKIRKNFWKKKGYKAALKAFSLAQSIIITGNSRSFLYCEKKDNISDILTSIYYSKSIFESSF